MTPSLAFSVLPFHFARTAPQASDQAAPRRAPGPCPDTPPDLRHPVQSRFAALARLLGLALLGATLLQACSSMPGSAGRNTPPVARAPGSDSRPGTPPAAPASGRRPGGYYQDDGPGSGAPDIDSIPDAVPRLEPLAARANRPYSVFGIQYLPLTQLKPYREKGMASWYGRKFHGQATSNGERYDMYAMTAAHPTLPLPSYVRVSNPRNGKAVIVRVNDRGPFLNNRIIDLSYTAAAKLGYVNQGSTEVEVELIDDPVRYAMNNGTRPASEPATTAVKAAPVVAVAGGTSSGATAAPGSAAPGSVTSGSVTSGTTSAGAVASGSTSPAAESSNGKSGEAAEGAVIANAPGSSKAGAEDPLVLTRETLITTPAGANAPGLYLQLGAFSARESAEATRQRLAQQFPWLASNSSPRTEYLLRPEAGLFKLHVGPYKTRSDAMASIDRLRSESGLQAFVVTR